MFMAIHTTQAKTALPAELESDSERGPAPKRLCRDYHGSCLARIPDDFKEAAHPLLTSLLGTMTTDDQREYFWESLESYDLLEKLPLVNHFVSKYRNGYECSVVLDLLDYMPLPRTQRSTRRIIDLIQRAHTDGTNRTFYFYTMEMMNLMNRDQCLQALPLIIAVLNKIEDENEREAIFINSKEAESDPYEELQLLMSVVNRCLRSSTCFATYNALFLFNNRNEMIPTVVSLFDGLEDADECFDISEAITAMDIDDNRTEIVKNAALLIQRDNTCDQRIDLIRRAAVDYNSAPSSEYEYDDE